MTRRPGDMCWLRFLLLLAAVGSLAAFDRPTFAQGGKKTGGDDTLDLLDDLNKDGGNWWNKEWSIRRQIVLEGPGLDALEERIAFFQDPDPLLLYNTGRCQA